MGLGLDLAGHVMSITRRPFLRVPLGKLQAVHEFDGVFQIQEELHVAMPVVHGRHGLEEGLVDPHRPGGNTGHGCDERFKGGDIQFFRPGEQVRVRWRWEVVVEHYLIPRVRRHRAEGVRYRNG